MTQSRRVFLSTHENPDGDAIGSLLALGLALEAWGKAATLFADSPIPAVYRFLPAVERIVNQVDAPPRFDAAVILDCASLSRCGRAAAVAGACPILICLDHHPTNTGFGHLRWIDPAACATAEVVYHLIKAMGVALDTPMATAIYTGILTDTGSFRFANTNRAAFAICAEMVALGVDPYQAARHVYGTYSLGRIKLLNRALDSIEIAGNGKISIMTLSKRMLAETGTHTEDIEGLIHYARRIEDVKLAALIVEDTDGHSGRFHVSLRSDGDVDVGAIAAGFGGGGHPNAAGFSIDAGLGEIKAHLIGLVKGL